MFFDSIKQVNHHSQRKAYVVHRLAFFVMWPVTQLQRQDNLSRPKKIINEDSVSRDTAATLKNCGKDNSFKDFENIFRTVIMICICF